MLLYMQQNKLLKEVARLKFDNVRSNRITAAASQVMRCSLSKDLLPEYYLERADSQDFKDMLEYMSLNVQEHQDNNLTIGLIGPKGIGKSTLAIGSLIDKPGVINLRVRRGISSEEIVRRILSIFGCESEVGKGDILFDLNEILVLSKSSETKKYNKSDLVPTIVIDCDISCTLPQIIDILSLAKQFGDQDRLAHFVVVFSASIISTEIDLLSHRCLIVPIAEASEKDVKAYDMKLLGEKGNFSNEEKEKLATEAIKAYGCNFLLHKGMILYQRKNDPTFIEYMKHLQEVKVEHEEFNDMLVSKFLKQLRFDETNEAQVKLLTALVNDFNVSMAEFTAAFGLTALEVLEASKKQAIHPFAFADRTWRVSLTTTLIKRAFGRKIGIIIE